MRHGVAFLVGFVAVILGIPLFAASMGMVYEFARASFGFGIYAEDVDKAAIRNIGLVLAALLGAPFLIWRTIVAARQVQIADEALFNDKINAAAHDLAARREVTRVDLNDESKIIRELEDDLVTRAAAIDRLEGLVAERPDMAPRIDRLLATYVRGTFPHDGLDETEDPKARKTPRMDLQRAVDAIGRLHPAAIKQDQSQWRLDLKGCDFDGVSFRSGDFWAADFTGSRLEAAMFDDASCHGCLFRDCLLGFVTFFDSDLTGAKFTRAKLRRAGDMYGLAGASSIRGSTFESADISGHNWLGDPKVISTIFGTADTVLAKAVDKKRPDFEIWDMGRIALESVRHGFQ